MLKIFYRYFKQNFINVKNKTILNYLYNFIIFYST